MRYIYEIAGLRYECDLPFKIKIEKESANFISTEGDNADMCFKFIAVDEIAMPSEYHSEVMRLYCKDKTYFLLAPNKDPYACISQTDNGMLCEYVRGKESYIDSSHHVCNLMQVESILNDAGGVLLHASFIKWHGMAVLFSAPSGTGKSTQAELWGKHENADIINGDRCGLRKKNDIWYAYGLPYAGSSRIYRNESAELGAIIVLRQAMENKIRKLNSAEAIKCLFPEVTIHRWDVDFVNSALDIMTELVEEIPVYLLECLPDAGAVETVKSEIIKQWE